jgi:hypothetical protein
MTFTKECIDETLPNFTPKKKTKKKKQPRKGEIKETRGKDQSPGKQTTQMRWGHGEEREPLRTKLESIRLIGLRIISSSKDH